MVATKMLPRCTTSRERDRLGEESMVPPYRDPVVRFMEKIERDPGSGCWLWTAATFRSGYAQFGLLGKAVYGHRWSYEHHVAPIPEGMQVDHACKVRRCVNPDHLRLATNKQNCEHRYDGPTRGASWIPRLGKWAARIKHNGQDYWLGTYATMDEAVEVARLKRLELFTHNLEDRR